jgi:hypothetical protein
MPPPRQSNTAVYRLLLTVSKRLWKNCLRFAQDLEVCGVSNHHAHFMYLFTKVEVRRHEGRGGPEPGPKPLEQKPRAAQYCAPASVLVSLFRTGIVCKAWSDSHTHCHHATSYSHKSILFLHGPSRQVMHVVPVYRWRRMSN